jgi:peptide/nickel transport system permease protein
MTTTVKAVKLDAEGHSGIKEESPFHLVFRRFRKHRLAVIALVVITLVFVASLLAPAIAPFEPDELNVSNHFARPGAVNEESGKIHLLGTDNIGRDYFSRVLYAGRISLTVAILAVFTSILIGITIGSISGFYGGTLDSFIMRFVEFMLTIPTLPLLLILSSMLIRNPDVIPIPTAMMIVIVLSGLGWMGSTQLMRGMVLALREQTFVEASRSLGASNPRIIFVHMIPNAMAPIIVEASLALAGYIIYEASLSFLGFGIQDPIPTWGNMLAATQSFMADRPWLPLVPGLPIFLCSLCFNYIGDGLRDALDPRLKM